MKQKKSYAESQVMHSKGYLLVLIFCHVQTAQYNKTFAVMLVLLVEFLFLTPDLIGRTDLTVQIMFFKF